MCLCKGNIFLLNSEGIVKVSLKIVECKAVVQLNDEPCMLTSFGSQVLFTNQNRASVRKIKAGAETDVFAGCERGEGSVDGKRIAGFNNRWAFEWNLKVSFPSVMPKQIPSRYALTWPSVLNFLTPSVSFFYTFPIHKKGVTWSVKSVDESLSLVHQCKELLDSTVNNIRRGTGITSAINGPQGHVSAKMVASVALLEWGLQRLCNNRGHNRGRRP